MINYGRIGGVIEGFGRRSFTFYLFDTPQIPG
jgi:hypothetical protein